MVHFMTPNGQRLMSYGYQNMAGLLTSTETLDTKNAVNELNFTPVTHTTYSDTRFCRYGFLKSGYSAELF
jgi:hypothetical protein